MSRSRVIPGTAPPQSLRPSVRPDSAILTRDLRGSSLLCTSTGIPYSALTVGVPLEIYPNERRVALTPQNAGLLLKKGFGRVLVEKNAGAEAQFLDEQYRSAGAILVDRDELYSSTDILLKVRPPVFGTGEAEKVKEGSTLISFLYPNQNKEIIEALSARKATAFAMEMIPRISRAQVFDALRYASSMILRCSLLSGALAPWRILLATRQSWRLPTTLVVSSPVRSLQQGEHDLGQNGQQLLTSHCPVKSHRARFWLLVRVWQVSVLSQLYVHI